MRRCMIGIATIGVCVLLTPPAGGQNTGPPGFDSDGVAGTSDVFRDHLSADHRTRLENVHLRRMRLRGLPLSDFLELIAQRTGINIVNRAASRLKVDVAFEDVSARVALEIILKIHGLACYSDGPVLQIVDETVFRRRFGRPFDEDVQTRLVGLRWISTREAAMFLNNWTQKGLEMVSDPQRPVMLLQGPAPVVEQAQTLLRRWEADTVVRFYRLKYLDVKAAADLLRSLLPSYASIQIEEGTNLLSVKAAGDHHALIEQWLREWDIPPQSVRLEAKLVQVTLSDEDAFGVDWEAVVKQWHDLDFVSKFDILNPTDKHGRLRIGVLDEDDYTALLEALRTQGRTRILSSPSVTALNNTEARILVGSTEPYVTTTTTAPASGPITVSETVNFIDVGVKLYVTPTIYGEGLIRLSVRPEVSSVTRQVTTSNNNTIPVVDTSEAEMTLMVKDGVTVVIGGLIKDEWLETTGRVPVLGDLPVLGWLFRNHVKRLAKTEILIFLTPRLFHPEIPAAPPPHAGGGLDFKTDGDGRTGRRTP